MENTISLSDFLGLASRGLSLGLCVGFVVWGFVSVVRHLRRSLQASFMIQ